MRRTNSVEGAVQPVLFEEPMAPAGLSDANSLLVGVDADVPDNDELMRGETGTLVGLEHAIAKRGLFRHLEIGCNLRGIHKLELWCGRRAGRRCQIARDGDQVGPIHFCHRHTCRGSPRGRD